MGNGTDIAMNSARIVLVHGDLNGIVRARHLSQRTMRNIRQNLVFAFILQLRWSPCRGRCAVSHFRDCSESDDSERRHGTQLRLSDHECPQTAQITREARLSARVISARRTNPPVPSKSISVQTGCAIVPP
jgi:hypothetical protein